MALRGLKLLGAKHVSYLVPDRIVDGYGLTAPIAERVKASGADVLVTVDNGIASIDGVARAKALGLQVLVTDHHLPALFNEQIGLPDADVIVNPNQPGCTFESKSIAGVGVMFYVLLALRAELRARGVFDAAHQPKLDTLLPLVALGTVADVVKLDANNRRLVAQGLRRIRAGALPAGIASLFKAAGRQAPTATTFDFGFALGPRINAAGRLADMTLGIECLLTDDPARADELAQMLDGINRERRSIESGMRDQAELVAKRHPGVLLRFGGHAMAAGCTISEEHFEQFEYGLQQVASEWLDAATLTRRLDTDGPLAPEYRRADVVDTLHKEVWGQGFAAPTFSEEVEVVSQRLVGDDKHLSLKLKHRGEPVDGIWFGHTETLPARVTLAFRLDTNEWKGVRRVQFLIEAAEVQTPKL